MSVAARRVQAVFCRMLRNDASCIRFSPVGYKNVSAKAPTASLSFRRAVRAGRRISQAGMIWRDAREAILQIDQAAQSYL
jgi:hypothetical protein